MRVQIIDKVLALDNKEVRRGISIPWRDKYRQLSKVKELKRRVTSPYWSLCWWLYDHTNLFIEIPENGDKFSWRYLRIFGLNYYCFSAHSLSLFKFLFP